MEARKITIIQSREQKTSVIMSAATTLAELKQDLTNAGIDYTDQTFMEGLTKTELRSDESLLPQNVVRVNRTTGEQTTTNELVFMLTNVAKKIKSGSTTFNMTRSEMYNYIKENNLKDKTIEVFGKQFTRCSNEELQYVIENNVPQNEEPVSVGKALCLLVEALYSKGLLSHSEFDAICNALEREDEDKCNSQISSSYSQEELDEMFQDLLD